MDDIDWTNTEEIGFRLHESHPNVEPLTVRFTDLRDLVLGLPGFVGTTEHCGEKLLEAIQMAWLEERQDDQDAG